MGTRHPRLLAEQRDWMLRRLEAKPDLTLRALVAELHERAIPASYGSVWRLLDDEGISFKKKPARKRAGPA
jgi:transposase